MNRLINDFNSLKNNILNNRKENKTNQKPRSQYSSSKTPLRTKPIWLRKNKSKCQFVLNSLKDESFSKCYLDNGCSRHMKGDKSSFTSLENYDGGIVIFGDGNLTHVKDKVSIVILGFPKLNEVLYVEELKANLLKH